MSKLFITRACAAAALVATSPAAFAQENTANAVNTADPALNTTADPAANDIVSVNVTDPLANDPLATAPAPDPMLNDTDVDDDDDDGGRFPWGLLGLLGLAGLLGTRRRDDDVRVDSTRDTR